MKKRPFQRSGCFGSNRVGIFFDGQQRNRPSLQNDGSRPGQNVNGGATGFKQDWQDCKNWQVLYGKAGFTLVELLMVITIIAMLSTLSITTMRVALESAKESRTQVTIGKLDAIVTNLYEKYQYKKIETPTYASTYARLNEVVTDLVNNGWGTGEIGESRTQIAVLRLLGLREQLIMDFPCSWEECFNSYSVLQYIATGDQTQTTPLNEFYRLEIELAQENWLIKNANKTSDDFPKENCNAELLYLVVMNGDPETRALFTEREIGDVDGNGLYEFIDGWNRPIQWLRWAPGFENSDRQFEDSSMCVDPLDTFGVGNCQDWFLVPLIVSAGKDGRVGLNFKTDTNFYQEVLDMGFGSSVLLGLSGLETDDDGTEYADTCYDNIHNHTLVQ